MGRTSYGNWRPYVSAAERRRRAAKKAARLKNSGRELSPIAIAGHKIAATFWGVAWCKNLESYSDYSNRLPRGRTYLRNGSVIDLQIEAGRVRSLVSGTSLYEVDIRISRLAEKPWAEIKGQCAGRIDSLVELLQGSISGRVMEIVTRKGDGLFPAPREIDLACSCPDWAVLCKHVAATLYGVGARLDAEPELLFTLRGVDVAEMLETAIDQPPANAKARKGRRLAEDDLSSVFGIDIELGAEPADERTAPATRGRRAAQAKKKPNPTTTKKQVKKKSARGKPTPARLPGKKKAAARKAAAKKTANTTPTARKKTASKKTSRRKTKNPAGRSSE